MLFVSSVLEGVAVPVIRSKRSCGTGVLRTVATLFVAVASGSASAQSFTENFDDISQLAGRGWGTQNNSTPVGSLSWFQGTPTNATPTPGPFNAYNGAADAYIAANFNSTGSAGTISNWLIMPNRTLRNGDVFTFYTRKPTIGGGQTDFPDRLEVRLSTNGASTNVGTGAAGTGDFTTLLMSINPTLVANVYPQMWTQYTITMSGLPAPTSGRMAFRYFVTGAGSLGTNSDYIGIDAVAYTPYVCPALTMTPGGALSGGVFGQPYSTSLTQTGALGAPNYAVTAGALPPGLTLSANGTISGTSTDLGTFNFTVTVSDASGCNASQSYSITVVPTVPGVPTDVSASAGDAQIDVSWVDPANDGGSAITSHVASCTDGTNSFSAPGTVSPITVGGLVNGTAYTCTVAAINGEGAGTASTPSNSVTPKGNQSIAFGPQAGQIYGPGRNFSVNPPATASSGLDVSYGSTTPGVCTVMGATVSIVSAGSCTLSASQPGNGAWNPALPVEQTLVIDKADQTLTFPPQTEPVREFEAGATFAIDPLASSATPNSGLAIVYVSLDPTVCEVGGTTVTMVGPGHCVIAAKQSGNGNYNASMQVTTQVVLSDTIFEDGFEDLPPM